MFSSPRYVCHFSCGAASAVAAKLTLGAQTRVIVVNAFVAEEHPDNRRFLSDCEKWFGQPVIVLQNKLFNASTKTVWKSLRFIKNKNSAPCSRLLKRDVLAQIKQPGDVTVIGYTFEEAGRAERLQELFTEEAFSFPLIELHMTKNDCLAIVERAGILLPYMYRIGYRNANCIGCPKGGQNYWQKIRKDFPQEFEEVRKIQEEIGSGASFLRFRSGPRKEERMPLAELPPGEGNLGDEASFECGFICELVSDTLGNE